MRGLVGSRHLRAAVLSPAMVVVMVVVVVLVLVVEQRTKKRGEV